MDIIHEYAQETCIVINGGWYKLLWSNAEVVESDAVGRAEAG